MVLTSSANEAEANYVSIIHSKISIGVLRTEWDPFLTTALLNTHASGVSMQLLSLKTKSKHFVFANIATCYLRAVSGLKFV